MSESFNEEEFFTLLRNCLKKVVADKDSRSISWLASQADVSSKTLSRFAKGQTQTLKNETASSLCVFLLKDHVSYCMQPDELSKIKSYLDTSPKNSEAGEQALMSEEIEDFLLRDHRDSSLLVFLLCTLESGVSHKTIYSLGNEAREVLQEMIQNSWVYEAKNRYHFNHKNVFISANAINRKVVELFARSIHYKNREKIPTASYYGVESLNVDGMKKLNELLKNQRKQVQEILNETKYRGDIPAFYLSMFDYFTDTGEND